MKQISCFPQAVKNTDGTTEGKMLTNMLSDNLFTVPEFREDGSEWDPVSGTDIVIRFYIVSDNDENARKPSISLIIPGNLSDEYYDTSGRKIQKHICPVGGCYQ